MGKIIKKVDKSIGDGGKKQKTKYKPPLISFSLGPNMVHPCPERGFKELIPFKTQIWGAKLFLVFAALVCLLLPAPGCMKAGPDYTPPVPEIPDQWRSPDLEAFSFDRPDQVQWWEVFGDPILNELMVRAADANLDLAAAAARIREARANIGVAKGGLVPDLSASASATHQKTSENNGAPGGTSNSLSGSFGSSWQVDLFGRIARSIEAYTADYEASLEDRAGVMVTLYAQVAEAYVTARASQARLAAVKDNIISQKEMLAITQSRFRNGLASGLDVSQAKGILAGSFSQIPLLENQKSQAFNSLAQLLAEQPGALDGLLSEPRPIPLPPARVAVGVPADILRQRPDIRQAERQLAAATARVGQATADLYPSLSLDGALGLASAEPGDFFKAGSGFYSLGPSFSWNLFNGGQVKSQIQVQNAQQDQALVQYRKTVLGALHEVDNALTDFYRQGQRVMAQEKTVVFSRETLRLAAKLYVEGLKDFQSVLDAQRSLFEADDDLAQARGDYAASLVGLYQALGGGWKPAMENTPGRGEPVENPLGAP